MSLPIRLDLHVHSSYSPDSTLSPAQILEHMGAAGLNGFALTDHNTTAGHAAIRALRDKFPAFWFIPGVEVSAREGHALVYGVAEAPARDLPVVELVEWAHARNAVVVLAHPYRWVHGVGGRVARSAPVDGVEVWNGRNPEIANRHAELVAAQRRLSATGGSDAHEPSTLGRAFTEFLEPPADESELIEWLRRGRVEAGGRSLTMAGRVRLMLRNGVLRARRGFRPV
jgi:hypothetical protein